MFDPPRRYELLEGSSSPKTACLIRMAALSWGVVSAAFQFWKFCLAPQGYDPPGVDLEFYSRTVLKSVGRNVRIVHTWWLMTHIVQHRSTAGDQTAFNKCCGGDADDWWGRQFWDIAIAAMQWSYHPHTVPYRYHWIYTLIWLLHSLALSCPIQVAQQVVPLPRYIQVRLVKVICRFRTIKTCRF